MAAASLAGTYEHQVHECSRPVRSGGGHTLRIGFGDREETRTILTVGTSGSGGTGITVTSPLTMDHAQNTVLRDMNTTRDHRARERVHLQLRPQLADRLVGGVD